MYSGVFCATFFAFRAPFFAFCISRHGRHLRENSKYFVVYFFVALIKREIHMKCEKCIAGFKKTMIRIHKIKMCETRSVCRGFSFFHNTSRNRFLIFCVLHCFAVQAVTLQNTKGFSHKEVDEITYSKPQ